MWADEGISVSFQADTFDLTMFGSSSTASVKAQSYDIWMTQSHSRSTEVFDWFYLLQCAAPVDHRILTF